jgi:hypothetical protein
MGPDLRRHAELDRAGREAAAKAREARGYAQDLERRLDKLTLISMALWSMLSETTKFSEEDLMERVRQIDLMDGVEDGKLEHQKIVKCAQCGRTMSARHQRCLYCGAEKAKLTAFDDLI